MIKNSLLVVLTLTLALGTAPAWGGSFGLFGSYWETDALDETFGGGLSFGIEVSELIDVDLRAAYQEELTDDPLEALFEDDDPVFERRSVDIIPVEAGLRFNFNREGGGFHPYLGGGVSYFFIDHERERVNIDDEVGFYLLGGSRFGDGEGVDLVAEIMYRQVELTAEGGDVGDLEDRVELDLDGPVVNLGLVWSW